jgi:outer membrane PBP1 activator LpoA protein
VQNVVLVNDDTPLLRRFASAFAAEWLLAGGSVPPTFRFEATPDALRSMRRELNRSPPQAALLALDSASATLAKPYLGTIPVYASGLVFERETVAVARDLDGIRLLEIPWIVTPDAPQFATLPRREFASAALTRLYALGLDAFRIAQAFRDGAPERFSLDGATGQVTLEDGRQFVREGRMGVFRAGELTPFDAPR